MNHFVLDVGCTFFEWQDTYAANLGHHQQVAQGIHLVPQRRSSTNPMPPQSTIVPFSCGRPRELHPPSRYYKGILYRPRRRPLRSKQLIWRPLSRLLLDQSFVAHNPVHPKPLHSQQSAPRTAGSPDMALISLFVSVINLLATALGSCFSHDSRD
jgi:hypothetical protein